MEVDIKHIFKDEHFHYHCVVDETGIVLTATNKHGEVVSEKWINVRHFKKLLGH